MVDQINNKSLEKPLPEKRLTRVSSFRDLSCKVSQEDADKFGCFYQQKDFQEKTLQVLKEKLRSTQDMLNGHYALPDAHWRHYERMKKSYQEAIDWMKKFNNAVSDQRDGLWAISYAKFRQGKLEDADIRVLNAMREAYYGGVSETYNLKAENVVRIYDINSSYPASMKQDMPIGKPVFSTDPGGLDNYFGIVYARVETPRSSKNIYEKIDYPPLPFRLVDGGIINPIGKWSGWYSSELLKYVRNVWGYKIHVFYGYKFNKGVSIFEKFVDKYYRIKAGYDKHLNINRDTSKLMLNSSYGRTGMKLDDVETKFVTSKESKELQSKYQVIDVIQFTPEIDWIKYRRRLNDSFIWTSIYKESNTNQTPNIIQTSKKSDGSALWLKESDSKYDIEQSLPIAIFTSAYSTIRLFEGIRKIKESGGIVYAVDTDSIHTDGFLPDNYIGSELGLWKLEFEGERGLYPLPKVYLVEEKIDEKVSKDKKIKDIKKGKGLKKKSITKEEYLKLTQGESIEKEEYRFKIIKKEFRIKFEKTKICLSAELNKRIPNKDGISTKPLLVIDGEVKYIISKNKRHDQDKDKIENITTPSPSHSNQIRSDTKIEINQFNKESYPKNLHDLEKFVSNKIHESMMLAGNQATMRIYELTGIMYTIDGDMYYSKGKGRESRRIDIKINGDWLNKNITMKSGRLRFKNEERASSCNSRSFRENSSYFNDYKSKPPDIIEETPIHTEELMKTDILIIVITNLIVISKIGLIATIKIYWFLFKFLWVLFKLYLETLIFIIALIFK